MRKTTRSKYNGRTEVAQALSTMILEFDRMLKSVEYHKFGGARLMDKFLKIRTNIHNLHFEVVNMPVTQDEKIIAKVKRKKEADSARSKNSAV